MVGWRTGVIPRANQNSYEIVTQIGSSVWVNKFKKKSWTNRVRRRTTLLQFDATLHTALLSQRALRDFQYEALPHPTYSPDMLPLDYAARPRRQTKQPEFANGSMNGSLPITKLFFCGIPISRTIKKGRRKWTALLWLKTFFFFLNYSELAEKKRELR